MGKLNDMAYSKGNCFWSNCCLEILNYCVVMLETCMVLPGVRVHKNWRPFVKAIRVVVGVCINITM